MHNLSIILTEDEARSLLVSIRYSIRAHLNGQASARRRLAAASEFGDEPDAYDELNLQQHAAALRSLRRVLDKLGAREEARP